MMKKFETMFIKLTRSGTVETFEYESFENGIKCRVMLIRLKDGSYGIEKYRRIR